ncbi:hypothetical protein CAAN3_05S01002 [[Candida] anglica]
MKYLSLNGVISIFPLIASVWAQSPITTNKQLSATNYVTCGGIKYEDNSWYNPMVRATLKAIETQSEEERDEENSAELPLFIFHYTDILKLDGLPSIEELTDPTQPLDGVVDYENLKFNVEVNPEFKDDDTIRFLNTGFTTVGDVVEFNVTQSGIYCMYVAPHGNVEELHVDVQFQSSYGYIPYASYIKHVQSKYYVILGSIIIAYLLNYIIKFKVGSDFKDLNSVSIITKVVIFYILAPSVLISLARYVLYFVFSSFPTVSLVYDDVFNWLTACFAIVCRWFTLLFSMGYGVIYYRSGYLGPADSSYKELPTNLWYRAYILLLADLTSTTIFALTNSLINSSYDGDLLFGSLNAIFSVITTLFSLVWLIHSIISYRATKTLIEKFPPFSSVESNSELLKSFRRSILIIFVLPAVFGVILGVILGVKSAAQMSPPEDLPLDSFHQEIASLKIFESMYFSAGQLTIAAWIGDIFVLSTVGALFFIWIKNNYGVCRGKEVDDFIIDDE